MKKILFFLAMVAACGYTTTEFYAVKTTVKALPKGTCDVSAEKSDINRVYDGVPCGAIATTACNSVPSECEQSGFQYCGGMHWTVLDHVDATGSPVCRQGNDGKTCHWSGIDRPSGPDLHDCIVKWQTEMFNTTGCYENNNGGISCTGYCYNCGPYPVY